ncbi:MAG: DUF350 domain-containing protein [Actinomycetota bacterium]|nr:DUF350 domain-containing protein [Actinomycetota bacterium]
MPVIIESLGYAAAYSLLGVVLLVVGFVALDVLTPGHLAQHIWTERSINAGIVLSAGFLAQGVIVFSAIWFNGAAAFGAAFLSTAAFGLLGVLMQAVAFLLIELVTPHKMGEVVTMVAFHPASLVIAAAQLAVSLAVVASIA